VSPIDPATEIGAVTLRVTEAARIADFYRRALGFVDVPKVENGADVELGAPGSDRPLLRLVEDRAAPTRPPRTTGLYHFAVLVPSRLELGRSLERLVEAGWRLVGASDHLVSEALYLEDPEGNGIEIYRDRPREEWRQSPTGELAMATLPLDLQSLYSEAVEQGPAGPELAPGTTIGHIHLNVADIDASESFYCGELGFDVIVRGYPGALFVAAGGYHHHIGLNTWNGPGAPSPPPGSLGLEHFEIRVPDLAEPRELTDPSGIQVHLTAA
jgi:catechol 2,3-dioxygenase